ncbi:putative nitrilase/cyanide hydratase [Microlunatus endophyticus]|uniref:Nitrilase/cyanide hydratase n=1 Tax=Microlunatus endophyticus TaxID=1716077 RepID=A0A917SC17_9ACTN|nr:carbon-nitrogen hydrolase family protein [Microlunatus endophyticus]GGL66190.1 putative nitrilase/cyanide hydratase [Microlunatus endophyticus]
MRVALAQLTSTADPQANLDLVEDSTRRAAERGAELVIFPEAMMCAFGNRLDTVAEPLDGSWVGRLTTIAQTYGPTIVAGMFTPGGQTGPDGRQKVINTLVATGPGGLASYQKIHLFDAFGFAESDTVVAGTEPVIIEVAGTSIGLTLCYDVRFPGLYQTLAERGAEVIIVSASWGAGPGKVEQWQLLTQARALDSTCFILAAGQADPATQGHRQAGSAPTGVGYSAVIDPSGGAIAGAGAEPELLITDIDPGQVSEVRKIIPVLANRRF